MHVEAPDSRAHIRDAAFAAAIVVVFLIVRAVIAHVREPFFDELFSAWMARRPLDEILSALRYDSGPPLYYVFARFDSVAALRIVSVAIACVPLVLLLKQRRWVAASLLAVHPAAALFAASARPYALCAALIAVGVLLLERDRVWPASAAVVAAAYSHYYGALFLPTLLFCRAPLRDRILATAAASLTFLPGVLLAFAQPKEATAWMTPPLLADILRAITFLSEEPQAGLRVTVLAALLTAVAVARATRNAVFVLIPLSLAVALSLLLRPAFFPIRFASVIAFPLVLWVEGSLVAWSAGVRRLLLVALLIAGSAAIAADLTVQRARPTTAYREAAVELRRNAPATETIVASGYLYLEAVHQLPRRRVQAFPREQALHPGWRTRGGNADAAALPRTPFIWIGELRAPERVAIERARRTQLLFANEGAVILRVF